jgi:hypothetical protein
VWRNSFLKAGIVFLTCVVSLAGGTALGDVIPISLSQSISGSASPIICVGGLFGTCSTNGASFSASNSTVGPYGVNESAQATATLTVSDCYPSPCTLSATSSVQADQGSDETANSISVSMDANTEIATVPPVEPVDGGNAVVTNNYSFQFDLTAPSLVHLTGSAYANEFGTAELPNFSQSLAFSLTGPGFDLDSTSPSSPVHIVCEDGICYFYLFPENIDDTFSLPPGVYSLSAIDDISQETAIAIDLENTAGLSLQLDFTPVPEPRWNGIVLFLLLTTACLAARRITNKHPIRPSLFSWSRRLLQR